jgi:hypothetical protein
MSCLVAMQQLHTLLGWTTAKSTTWQKSKRPYYIILKGVDIDQYMMRHAYLAREKKRLRAVWWPQATKWIGSILRCQESHTHPYAAPHTKPHTLHNWMLACLTWNANSMP